MRPTCKRGLLAAAAAATAIAGVAVAPGGAGAAPGAAAFPPGPVFGAGCPTPAADAYGDAGDLFALTTDARLLRLSRTGALERSVALAGLPAGVRLLGIDTRPATGQVYGVGSDSRLYVLDPASGAAAAVGTGPFTPAVSGAAGVDFNPVVDRLRVVTDSGQNLRIDPVTGTAVADTALGYPAGGAAPAVSGAAYTNSAAGATSTTLYDLDPARDALVVQGSVAGQTPVVSPNTGQLREIGRLGLDIASADGFDVVGGRAYAAVRTSLGASVLIGVDLATGRATTRVGLRFELAGLTGSAGPVTTAYATTAAGQLLVLDRNRPTAPPVTRTVTGLQPGERLVGIDVRPATGRLLGVGSTSRVYLLDPLTGAATAVGAPFTPALAAGEAAAGVDVNPVPDRVRVVTASGANLRIVPDTGAATADGQLAYAADDPNAGTVPAVTGAAYTNPLAGATTTTLYDLDAATGSLVVQNPPNAGTLRTVGPLRVAADLATGFDIGADGVAVAALRPAGTQASALYCVDLTTGRARLAGRVGAGGVTVTGLALAPRGVRLGR